MCDRDQRRVWAAVRLFASRALAGGNKRRLFIPALVIATFSIATPSLAEWIDQGDQVINGTQVHTTIYHDRGYATFSNSCGTQSLTQRQLQGGAIPSDIIPCPRPSGEERPSSGASSPPPGRLSDAQCNKLGADFDYLFKDTSMPAEYRRFLMNEVFSADPEMFSIQEPEKACTDVTVYRSIRREMEDVTRRIIAGCSDRIAITDSNGERIDADNVDLHFIMEEAEIDENADRICRVAQQQLARPPAKEPDAAKPRVPKPIPSALPLSPAIKKCLTDLHTKDPSQSLDDLVGDEVRALCPDYPAIKAAGPEATFDAYSALLRSGSLLPTAPRARAPAKTATAPRAGTKTGIHLDACVSWMNPKPTECVGEEFSHQKNCSCVTYHNICARMASIYYSIIGGHDTGRSTLTLDKGDSNMICTSHPNESIRYQGFRLIPGN